jgi:putative ABC transport system ATP-binding protein
MTAQPHKTAEAAASPLFRLVGVSKDYPMGEVVVRALRGVDLQIDSGEFLVILGPSGSGKSTLLNIIGGIDKPSSGDVFFRDRLLSTISERQLTLYRRHHIGFIFQFYNLMPNLTAEENVEMATEIVAKPLDAGQVLEQVGLGDRRDHFPSQLSGGEQQRVAIARAVAKQPEILLCDEPTGALDYSTGKTVLDVLRRINDETGTTVVVITHNASIGGMGDRIVRMRDGAVAEIVLNERPLTADELEW